MKKIILIIFCIASICNNIFGNEKYTIYRDFEKGIWQIFIEKSEKKELWYSIKDEFYSISASYILNNDILVFIGKDSLINKVDLNSKKMIHTQIPFNQDFEISNDSMFLCTFIKMDITNIESDIVDVFGISYKKQQYFPIIYNLNTCEPIKIFHILEVENYKGEIKVSYDDNQKSFIVQYTNDYPYSEYCYTIPLPNNTNLWEEEDFKINFGKKKVQIQ